MYYNVKKMCIKSSPMRGGTAYSILFKESRYTILDTFEEVSPATT